jgi:acyl-homoserine lactone acylase PvdQ
MVWRLVWRAIRLALALALVASVAGAYLFWRAMPAYSGSERLPGLSAEVHVWRDSHGVPHIFAASRDDAARALGYLHASERLFQMELSRRVGQGRLAEVFGADRLGVDKFIRTLGLYREAESSFAALPPWAQKRLEAYSDGVNAFLDTHKNALPPEFLIVGDVPEPWKPADSLVWGKLMALQLSANYEFEALRAHLLEKLGPEQAQWMFPGVKPGDPITTLPALNPSHASGESIEDEIGALTGIGRGASNEWVVSGSRTVTGKPILATRHGPVLSDVSKDLGGLAGPGKAIALAFTGLGDSDTTEEAIMRLDVARNWSDFLDAMRVAQTPTQNVVYADVSGDIGFFSPGLVPLRKSGDGLTPVDGASGAFDWIGVVPFDQLPQLHNPEIGFVFNANNANVSEDRQSTFSQDWEEDFRARRIQQFFDTTDKHSLETSAAMQADRLSLAAKALLPFIATIAPSDERARQAQAMLASWNAVMDKDRPEPLIFTAFLGALHEILLDDKTGLKIEVLGPFDATALVSLMRDHPSWCDAPDKPDPDCRKALGRALDEALALLVRRDGADMSRWRWGAEHVAPLTHAVYSQIPLLDRLSDLSVPSGGGFYTLDRGGGFETPQQEPFARTHGPGFRGLYDLADPERSRFMIATGESGHIFSPHYRDLVPLWNNVKSITLTGSEDNFKKAGARELILSP